MATSTSPIVPPPPSGFELDTPPPPPGFELDQPAAAPKKKREKVIPGTEWYGGQLPPMPKPKFEMRQEGFGGASLPSERIDPYQRIADTERLAAETAGQQLIEYSPITGVPQIIEGGRKIHKGLSRRERERREGKRKITPLELVNPLAPLADKDVLEGASDIMEGGGKTIAPALIPLTAAAPIPTLGAMAVGIPVQQGVQRGMEALGASPEAARFGSNVAGFLTGGGIFAKAAGRAGIAPELFGGTRKIAPPPVADALPPLPPPRSIEQPWTPYYPAEKAAQAFITPDAGSVPKGPKSAAKSYEVFAQGRRLEEPPVVPETGVPENVARATAAREQLAQEFFGKPFQELLNSERIDIDRMVSEGYGSVQPKPPAPEPPPPPPAAAEPPLPAPRPIDAPPPVEPIRPPVEAAPEPPRAPKFNPEEVSQMDLPEVQFWLREIAETREGGGAAPKDFRALVERQEVLRNQAESQRQAQVGRTALEDIVGSARVAPPEEPSFRRRELPPTPMEEPGLPSPRPIEATPGSVPPVPPPVSPPVERMAAPKPIEAPPAPAVEAPIADQRLRDLVDQGASKKEWMAEYQRQMAGLVRGAGTPADLAIGKRIYDAMVAERKLSEASKPVPPAPRPIEPAPMAPVAEQPMTVRELIDSGVGIEGGYSNLRGRVGKDTGKKRWRSPSKEEPAFAVIAEGTPRGGTTPEPPRAKLYITEKQATQRAEHMAKLGYQVRTVKLAPSRTLAAETPMPPPKPKQSELRRLLSEETGSMTLGAPPNPPPRTPGELYVAQKIADREAARKGATPGLLDRLKALRAEAKAKGLDSTSILKDTLAQAQKEYGFSILPKQDIGNQIDRVRRSTIIAKEHLEKSGLLEVIRDVDNLDNLDQYLIAKHAIAVGDRIETGRDLAADERLVHEFAPRYEGFARRVREAEDNLLNYSVEAGLVDPVIAAKVRRLYPDHIPLNRIIDIATHEGGFRPASGGPASLSTQSIMQKLKGAKLEVENPITSIVEKIYKAYAQGEQNKGGEILAGYRDLPGFKGLITETGPGNPPGKHTISYLDAGQKRTFNVPEVFAVAAKSLDPKTLGFFGQLFAAPVRLFKVGTTGFNLPFIAANVGVDIASTGVAAASRRSVIDPRVYLQALTSVVKHDDLYHELLSQGGGFTSFDLYRNQARTSFEKIRAGRSVQGRLSYAVSHPINTVADVFRAVENIVSRGEEFGRMRLYKGEREALLAKGRTLEDVRILATKESNNALPNYLLAGSWTRVLNPVFPYLNAGIQGTRSYLRRFKDAPVETTARTTMFLLAPVTAATLWNVSDPKRREAYADIQDYEKENNIIYVPPNPTKDANGRWEVIKIKLPPGLNNITTPVRRKLEEMYGMDPLRATEVLEAIVGTVSPVKPAKNELIATLTPQAIKPTVQAEANYDFFRETPRVGPALARKPAIEQVKDNTSGTARWIGGKLNKSPILVEGFINDTLGGIGPQVIHATDTLLAKTGVIPEDQIGGRSTVSAMGARFSSAGGGKTEQKEWTKKKEAEDKVGAENVATESKAKAVIADLMQQPQEQRWNRLVELQRNGTITEDVLKHMNSIAERKAKQEERNKPGSMVDFTSSMKSSSADVRAQYMADELKAAKTNEQKFNLLVEWKKNKLLTEDVVKSLTERMAPQPQQ